MNHLDLFSGIGLKMNHLDLFSGIGGFSLGLKKVFNIKNTYFSDIDKYAIDVFKYNFKKSKYVGSVTDVQSKELPKIDIITFGSPCQDFSLAGKRRGLEGQRSSLISEAIRLICECRPSFFIWENVKGTFSSNNGEDFWAILKEFTNIGGYRLEWQLLNTKWFLPQNRERIYLVGYIGEGCEGQIFPITENDEVFNSQIWNNSRKSQSNKNRHTRTINSSYHKMGSDNTYIKVGDFRYDEGLRWRQDNNSPTLTLKSNEVLIKSCPKIRRLTPIECERLQGFPDNWTKHGKELGKISDTQRYKMCGNAVTVNVVEAVGKKIKDLRYIT
jgi:DNA (cytosine-5)-methyltransferase 1